MSKTTLVIVVSLIVIGGVGFLTWRTSRGGSEELTFTTAQVERGTIVSTISASGNLIQTNTFTITTSATGVIKEVFVQEGEEVQKGQRMVELTLDQASEEEKIKAWAAHLSAQNSLASAEENKLSLEKGVEDAKGKLIVAQHAFDGDWGSTDYWDDERVERWSDLKSAEMALTVAEQKYGQADEAIEKVNADLTLALISYQLASPIITAPQTGKVSDISVVPGMTLSTADQKLLSIVGEQQSLVSVSVNEIDIPKIAIGQKATLTFDALSDKTFTGKVVGVDRTGSETQGVVSYDVLVRLDTNEDTLYPNMTATVEIITASKENVLWVPTQAVTKQRGKSVVMVLENDAPKPKPVDVGLETATQVEIVSGLSEGDVVIVSEQSLGDQGSPFGGMGGFRNMMRPGPDGH